MSESSKRNSLNNESWLVCQNITVETPVSLLNKLQNRKPAKKYILKDANALFGVGQLNAILGPSGSGKTTLLNSSFVYTDRLKSDHSQVLLMGEQSRQQFFMYCFVPQFSVYHEYLTVKEHFDYAFELKYSIDQFKSKAVQHYRSIIDASDPNAKKELSKKELKRQLIQFVQDKLNIAHIVNNKPDHCSGGELKRVVIGLELLCPPDLLVLDEPTTGLDSISSQTLMSYLKYLSSSIHLTVIATIHQPNYELLCTFHKVLFMDKQGQCIYNGTPKKLPNYFTQFQLSCPKNYNPADFMLDIATNEYGTTPVMRMREMQTQIFTSIVKQNNTMASSIDSKRFRPSVFSSKQAYLLSLQWYDLYIKNRLLTAMQLLGLIFGTFFLASFFDKRVAVLSACPPIHLLPRVNYTWSQVRNWTEDYWNSISFTEADLQLDRIEHIRLFNKWQTEMLRSQANGLFVITCTQCLSLSVLAAYAFPTQNRLFYNQRLNGYFSIKSYLVSKIFADLPYVAINSFLASLIFYTSMGYPLISSQTHQLDYNICGNLANVSTLLWDLKANETDQVQFMIDTLYKIEHQSQFELLKQFGRFFLAIHSLFMGTHLVGMVGGALFSFNIKAAIFLTPVMLVPSLLFGDNVKDKKLEFKFWAYFRSVSPIFTSLRLEMTSLYSPDRCRLLHQMCPIQSDFIVSQKFTHRWLYTQFELDEFNGTARTGITDKFVRNLMDLFYGDYISKSGNEVYPHFLNTIHVFDSFQDDLLWCYFKLVIFRAVMISIVYYKYCKV